MRPSTEKSTPSGGRQDAGISLTVRPASIQYRAGLPLKKKTETTIANPKTSDQRIGFLELGFI
jgi:hypothetical protein